MKNNFLKITAAMMFTVFSCWGSETTTQQDLASGAVVTQQQVASEDGQEQDASEFGRIAAAPSASFQSATLPNVEVLNTDSFDIINNNITNLNVVNPDLEQQIIRLESAIQKIDDLLKCKSEPKAEVLYFRLYFTYCSFLFLLKYRECGIVQPFFAGSLLASAWVAEGYIIPVLNSLWDFNSYYKNLTSKTIICGILMTVPLVLTVIIPYNENTCKK